MIPNKTMAFASVLLATALASGCVVEPAYRRPVVVAGGYATVVAPQPPPPWTVERVRPRPGYIWAPGYWRWDGRRYVSVRGHYERQRPGYHYAPGRWEHRRDGWHWHAGAWIGG